MGNPKLYDPGALPEMQDARGSTFGAQQWRRLRLTETVFSDVLGSEAN